MRPRPARPRVFSRTSSPRNFFFSHLPCFIAASAAGRWRAIDSIRPIASSATLMLFAPGANSISVAELAIGLMLSMARHLPAADAAMKQGKWEKKKFLGEEVREKTLGLAGLGRIGQEVARRASAFDMRIIAHDPFISEVVPADLGVELVSLDDLFARSDFLSLHMPSTPTTKNIVNADRLAKGKKRRRVIPTTRGARPTEARRGGG